MKTYIIKTKNNEFYCGKTNNLDKRLKDHSTEKYPHWFSGIKRKNWENIYLIHGDYEKKIKKFGCKNFTDIFKNEGMEQLPPPPWIGGGG